jgi:hypothetical protein
MSGDRRELWLPLLRELTRTIPGWSAWKDIRSALVGHGDVDSLAGQSDWPAIEGTWLRWVRANGLRPAIVCRHVPQGPHMVALDPSSPWLVQLDVKELVTFRGSAILSARQILPLSITDDQGVRRVRPGVEGILKLVMNGMKRGGRQNAEGLATKRVRELLAVDQAGVIEASRLFGAAQPAVVSAADAVLQGGWDADAARTVDRWALRASWRSPSTALSRLWFNAVDKRRCPVLVSIRQQDRRVPEDREGWLAAVRKSRRHRVVE